LWNGAKLFAWYERLKSKPFLSGAIQNDESSACYRGHGNQRDGGIGSREFGRSLTEHTRGGQRNLRRARARGDAGSAWPALPKAMEQTLRLASA
jgi:hypothetical protein